MKKIIHLFISMATGFAILLSISVTADSTGVLGDINGNGRVGLEEAIYALQIVAGIRPINETLIDAQAINAFWQSLEDLYATTPTNTVITNWFNSHVAADFFGDNESKTEMYNEWIAGDGPEVGLTLSAEIIEPMDVSTTIYTKGYWIRVYCSNGTEADNFIDSMVFDGANWLWYGDRKWLNVDANTHAFMYINSAGQRTFQTGLELSLDDEPNYAYNQGVRSAIVTGPGLPADGVVYEHQFPKTGFRIYQSSGAGVFYAISNDLLVSDIPDNAEYTFTLCSESAADLHNNGNATCTVLQAYTDTIMKPPLLNSELNASMFASLTNPTTHNASDLNFGGEISVSWTIPESTNSDEVLLVWSASSIQYNLSADNEGGNTSATLNTTGLPSPDGWIGLFIRVEDRYERDFNMGWEFF